MPLVLGIAGPAAGGGTGTGNGFASRWSDVCDRVWIGPEYWSNRLQDWRAAGGRLECVGGGLQLRTVHLLTHRLSQRREAFSLRVRLGLIEQEPQVTKLQIERGDDWESVARAAVIAPGWTAMFRVADWDRTRNTPYRVVYGNST